LCPLSHRWSSLPKTQNMVIDRFVSRFCGVPQRYVQSATSCFFFTGGSNGSHFVSPLDNAFPDVPPPDNSSLFPLIALLTQIALCLLPSNSFAPCLAVLRPANRKLLRIASYGGSFPSLPLAFFSLRRGWRRYVTRRVFFLLRGLLPRSPKTLHSFPLRGTPRSCPCGSSFTVRLFLDVISCGDLPIASYDVFWHLLPPPPTWVRCSPSVHAPSTRSSVPRSVRCPFITACDFFPLLLLFFCCFFSESFPSCSPLSFNTCF